MNIFGSKQASGLIAPWTDTLNFGASIKNFYNSLGDMTISSPTEIVTLLDGPEKVVRYGALTLSSSLTASLRCKGLTVICDSLTINSGGNLTMTARGCRVDRNDDPRYPFIDFRIPNKIGLFSSSMSRKAALDLIKAKGLAPWDRGFWDVDGGMLGLACSIVEAGSVTLMTATGCGASVPGVSVSNAVSSGASGNAGVNGGCGSGGAGAAYTNTAYQAASRKSGAGCPYSGGSGSGGVNNLTGNTVAGISCSSYSGSGGPAGITEPWNTTYDATCFDTTVAYGYGGGRAGNPGGRIASISGTGQAPGSDGTGGKLVIICYGNVTINSGGKIESNGSAGGNGGPSPGSGYGAGGGSGGGHVSIIYQGTYANSGTVQTAGGIGGTGGGAGGSGGAGSVVTKTFTQMGWN